MVTILIPTNICLIASRHASFKMYKKNKYQQRFQIPMKTECYVVNLQMFVSKNVDSSTRCQLLNIGQIFDCKSISH